MSRKTKTCFERAIFLSWYCSKGDCKFCYMSTQKSRISDPRLARRRLESVLAEALICKKFGWRVEFISGGYDSFSVDELVNITRLVYLITGQKQWLNVGVLSESELSRFKPFVEGVCGAVEIIEPVLHDAICPSKPLGEIEDMFLVCDRLGLKKAMTMIVGLGEKLSDFPLLVSFIRKYSVDKITFYRLKPQKGTPFTRGPDSDFYVEWVRRTRLAFPDIEIVVGSWLGHLEEISSLLEAGADSITKFPAIRYFGSEHAKIIESQAALAGRIFEGTLTDFRSFDPFEELKSLDLDSDLKQRIADKVFSYLKSMKRFA